jgi:tRNA (mo5U34)-methyltransferase
MTPEQILQKIDSLAPWFHCIDLGDGIKTKTVSAGTEPVDHPRETWEKIARCLPGDLTGKTVLDVGCNAGFYSIETKRRGAASVLGVDAQRHHVRQALFVRKLLGLDIEYRRMSVYDLTGRSVGRFDITLALGLIYHCKHLVLALERLYEVTKELLIIETAILPEQLGNTLVDHSGGDSVTFHPLVFAGNLPERKEQVFNWFLPGLSALKALLTNVGFSEIEVFDLKVDRAILAVRKPSSTLEGTVLSQLKAKLSLLEGPGQCAPASPLRFKLLVENSGGARWATQMNNDERGIVRLGSHLFTEDGEELMWDYGRATLKRDLEPDQQASVWIDLVAPTIPGLYIIEFDMVLEQITWFEDFGVETIRHSLSVS